MTVLGQTSYTETTSGAVSRSRAVEEVLHDLNLRKKMTELMTECDD